MKTVAEASEQLCWTALRSFLTHFSEQKLREFAADHQNETFYCLCVYFDGCYGDFYLYLNVPDQARKTAKQSKEHYPDLYKDKTIEEIEEEAKWNCGDFLYDFVNSDESWKNYWRPISRLFEKLGEELYSDDDSGELGIRWGEALAETACHVALDLESSDVLGLLRRTDDFRVICVDHDETFEDSCKRLERVRQTYSPLQ